MARAALKDIQIFNPYVNQNGSFNAYSYYDHGVESQENFRNAFPITDQCERSAQLMGDDYVRLKFNLTAYVPMAAFSFIRYDGQTFFLMNDYCPHSNGSRMEHDQQGNEMVVSDSYEYDMKFYSVANMLRKPICYRHVKVAKGATAADGYHEWDEPEVTVSATLETMYVIIVQSIEQYTSRLDSDFLLTRMLATIPTNGLDNTGIAPKNTVKLTAGTELATFNFNGEKIADVCTAVANTYSDAKKETEWYIEEDAEHSLTLHFCKCVDTGSMNHADDFSYKKTEGVDRYTKPIKTGGLKKVDYSRDESNIPQVIIPFGSERNMTYQAVKGIDEVSQMQSTFGKRLRLKTNHTCTIDGTQYPTAAMQAKGITGAYAVTDKDGNTVPLGVDAHGGIANDKVNTGVEKVEYFDDVYPQCHFQVSKVDVRNKKKDGATIPEYTCEGKVVNAQGQEIQPEGDFYPIQIEEGTTLSVRFESGYLNGREFEIANKTSKKADDGSMQTNYTLRFVIVADGSIEDGTLIPSGNFKPNVGDKFALFNMKMPEAYITYAQEELAQKAYEKLMEYQDTVPDVKCTSDPDSFSGKDVYFGAQYTINSEKLGFTLNAQNRRVPIDFISRIVAYSYKLTKVNDVSFTLSSALVRGVLSEMAAAITNVSYATDSLGQRSINLSRRGYRDASEVADMITNVTTEMMLVGNEKYQFQYTSEILPLHTNGVFTGLKVSYGQLQHTQQPYIDYANGGMWQIEPNASLNEDYQGNALDGTKPYYVFALCGTDSLDWATVILMDKDAAEAAGVYRKDAEISDQDAYPEYLLLGILSSEFAEEKNEQMTYERVFSPTNGFTAIEGGTITTEQIQDANRQLIIDFLSMPPRIIARGGAEIIGNITFKSFKDASTGRNPLEDLNNKIDQEVDELDERISHISVGGRNLVRDTAFSEKAADINDWTFYNEKNSPSTGKTLNGGSFKTNADDNTVDNKALQAVIKKKAYTETEDGQEVTKYATNRIMLTQTGAIGDNEVGDYYTFSALVKAATATTLYFGAGYSNFNPGQDSNQYGSAEITTAYTRIVITAKVFSTAANYKIFFLRLVNGEENTLTFKEVKLEKGTLPTSWTQAPEDIEEDIAAQKSALEVVKTDLQNQIDGVVDSYFMEGVPTMQNAPASDWSQDEYQRHEGDTYTNIQSYNTLDVTQWEQGRVYYGTNYTNVGKTLDQCKSVSSADVHTKGYRCKGLIEYKAGDTLLLNTNSGAFDVLITYYDTNGIHVADTYYSGSQHTIVEEVALNTSYTKCNISIRKSSAVTADDVRALGLCVNPTAGHSWRFCNSEGTGWHWHEIADSDAVKALQDAAAAQATADGKMRFFATTPYPPYQIGDMWAKQNAVTENGESTTKVEVLYSTHDRTDAYVATDWVSASEYAEFMATEAQSLANAAQQAADDAMAKAQSISNDGIISGGTEKQVLKREFVEIAGEDCGNNIGGTTPTDGSYRKALAVASTYNITSDATYTALTTAYGNLRTAMQTVFGVATGTTNIDSSNVGKDTYLSNDDGTQPTVPSDADYLAKTKAQFNALWKDYYDAEIALLNKASSTIDGRAQSALNQLADMASDGKLTAQEKLGVKREWLEIIDEKTKNKAEAVACGLPTGTGSKIAALDTAYTALQEYLLGKSTGTTLEKTGIIGHEGAISPTEMGRTTPDTSVVPGETFSADEFNTKFKDFYNANIDLLNAISTTVDGRAKDAMKKAEDIANDGIISGGTEKATIKKEWQEIAGDNMLHNTNGTYKKATDQAAAYGITSSQELSNLGTALGRLEYAMKEIVGYSDNAWTDANMQNDTYIGADYENPSTHVVAPRYDISMNIEGVVTPIDRDKFAALWRAYYDAEIALLNAVSDVIDQKEIGGENVLTWDEDYVATSQLANISNMSLVLNKRENPGSIYPTYETYPAGKYVFSADLIELYNGTTKVDILACILLKGSSYTAGNVVATIKPGKTQAVTDIQNAVKTFTLSSDTTLYLYVACASGSTFNKVHVYRAMLQRGEKKTEYQTHVAYLAEAFENAARAGTTDIDGGLLMTSLLKLRNEAGDVTAGMSGLTGTAQSPENVLMWGGATYRQALNAALNDYYKSGTSGDLITTLLKKDGTGKIGCFRVVDKDTVKVVSGEKTIIITNKSIDEVATVHNSHTGYLYGGYSINGGYGQNEVYRYEDEEIGKLSFTVQKGTFNINIPVMQIEASCSATSYPSSSAYEGQHDDGWGEGWWSYALRIEIRNNGNIIYSTSYKSDGGNVETDNGRGIPVHGPGTDNYFAAINQNFDLDDGSLEIVIFGDITVGISTQDDTNVHAGSHADASVSCGQGKVDVTNIDKFVVVAKDGFAVIANSNASFYIRNTETDLTLLAKGLPTSEPSEAGQLWVKTINYKNQSGNNASAKVLCIK